MKGFIWLILFTMCFTTQEVKAQLSIFDDSNKTHSDLNSDQTNKQVNLEIDYDKIDEIVGEVANSFQDDLGADNKPNFNFTNKKELNLEVPLSDVLEFNFDGEVELHEAFAENGNTCMDVLSKKKNKSVLQLKGNLCRALGDGNFEDESEFSAALGLVHRTNNGIEFTAHIFDKSRSEGLSIPKFDDSNLGLTFGITIHLGK